MVTEIWRVIESRGHRLAEFDVWEQASQAIHPEIHSRIRRERSFKGPDPPALSDLRRQESRLETRSITMTVMRCHVHYGVHAMIEVSSHRRIVCSLTHDVVTVAVHYH